MSSQYYNRQQLRNELMYQPYYYNEFYGDNNGNYEKNYNNYLDLYIQPNNPNNLNESNRAKKPKVQVNNIHNPLNIELEDISSGPRLNIINANIPQRHSPISLKNYKGNAQSNLSSDVLNKSFHSGIQTIRVKDKNNSNGSNNGNSFKNYSISNKSVDQEYFGIKKDIEQKPYSQFFPTYDEKFFTRLDDEHKNIFIFILLNNIISNWATFFICYKKKTKNLLRICLKISIKGMPLHLKKNRFVNIMNPYGLFLIKLRKILFLLSY